MSGAERILVVDDLSENLNLLTDLLSAEGYEVFAAPSGKIALSILQSTEVDLILLDILMPEMDGIETCRRITFHLPHPPPVIFISASSDINNLKLAFEVGGSDYVSKPFQSLEVLARVRNQLQICRLQAELRARNVELEAQISQRQKVEDDLSVASDRLHHISEVEAARWGLKSFVGASKQFQGISKQIKQLQGFSKVNVLVQGESGSGKELVARALHFGSDNRDKPFIAINCSAINESLAEAEFFGCVKGAFTGATQDRKGFFEMADGGTLFLDEVGDLPLSLQPKLLRLLELGQFYPVGSKVLKTVDVRIISATHCDLQQKQVEKTFREDLYFRLVQFTVNLPPLRDRLEDVEALAHYFVKAFSKEMKIPAPALADSALEKLCTYHFPGNIRELKNILERAIILSQGSAIESHHIQVQSPLPRDVQSPLKDSTVNLRDFKKQLAQAALEQCEGNVTAAAKLVGVHRSWFYRLEGK